MEQRPKKKGAIAESVIWSHVEIFEQLLYGQFYILFHLQRLQNKRGYIPRLKHPTDNCWD